MRAKADHEEAPVTIEVNEDASLDQGVDDQVEKESHSGYIVEGGLIVLLMSWIWAVREVRMYFYFIPKALETPSQTGVAWGPQSNFLNCSMGKQESNLPQVIQRVHDRAPTTVQVSCLPMGSLSLSCHSQLCLLVAQMVKNPPARQET